MPSCAFHGIWKKGVWYRQVGASSYSKLSCLQKEIRIFKNKTNQACLLRMADK